jgi:hypothetical protein
MHMTAPDVPIDSPSKRRGGTSDKSDISGLGTQEQQGEGEPASSSMHVSPMHSSTPGTRESFAGHDTTTGEAQGKRRESDAEEDQLQQQQQQQQYPAADPKQNGVRKIADVITSEINNKSISCSSDGEDKDGSKKNTELTQQNSVLDEKHQNLDSEMVVSFDGSASAVQQECKQEEEQQQALSALGKPVPAAEAQAAEAQAAEAQASAAQAVARPDLPERQPQARPPVQAHAQQRHEHEHEQGREGGNQVVAGRRWVDEALESVDGILSFSIVLLFTMSVFLILRIAIRFYPLILHIISQ